MGPSSFPVYVGTDWSNCHTVVQFSNHAVPSDVFLSLLHDDIHVTILHTTVDNGAYTVIFWYVSAASFASSSRAFKSYGVLKQKADRRLTRIRESLLGGIGWSVSCLLTNLGALRDGGLVSCTVSWSTTWASLRRDTECDLCVCAGDRAHSGGFIG